MIGDFVFIQYGGKMKNDFILPSNVKETENKEYAAKLHGVMAKNGGYCPCRLQHTDENLCICEEFRNQIANPDFEGFCHCKLYYKEK